MKQTRSIKRFFEAIRVCREAPFGHTNLTVPGFSVAILLFRC